MTLRHAAIFAIAILGTSAIAADEVVVRRVPNGGIKASAATDTGGRIHLAYFTGQPSAGDAWYVTSDDSGATYSPPLRVNSQPGTVIGASSARGPRLVLGRDDRVHFIWMAAAKPMTNSSKPAAKPGHGPHAASNLLYSQFDPATNRFTAPRNLMTRTVALDGESSVAADSRGNVYVVWHAALPEGKGEGDRSVWLARSVDDGANFSEEKNVLPEKTGVCPCCAITAQAGPDGSLAILYRAATDTTNRGMRLLQSDNHGDSFKLSTVDEWKLAMCPMSTASILATGKGFIGAWENEGRLGFGKLPSAALQPLASDVLRKHPTLAVNAKGETLLAWTEGVAFGKGGAIGWQRFDSEGKPVGSIGHADDLPGHGNVAALAQADGRFVLIY